MSICGMYLLTLPYLTLPYLKKERKGNVMKGKEGNITLSPLIDIIFPGSKLVITVNRYKNNHSN